MLDRVKASVRLMGKDLNLLLKESLRHLYGMSQLVKVNQSMPDSIEEVRFVGTFQPETQNKAGR
jgi:hypothetical protein